MDIAVKFENITKRYGSFAVLNDVGFEMPRGSSVGLAGVNGAGKTTLIKCLLGLCAPDGGSMEIFGASHWERGARARLAYLPERFNPPPFLKGRDFLNCALRLQGVDPDVRAIREVLRGLDFDEAALDLSVRAFSKGMAQKLGLAACFLSGKEFLVLDEPMSGLDPVARAVVKEKLLRLKGEGKTLLFTSHSLALMSEIGDRMAVLHQGRLKSISMRDVSDRDVERIFLDCAGRVANSGCGATV